MNHRVLVALSLAVTLAPARAAGAPDALTAEARARFKEGVALYDRGQFEAARAAFVQAYALKKHPDVLLNVAWSNLRAGRAEEAQAAFEHYLREAVDAPLAQRAEADRGLAEARSRATPAATTSTTAADVTPTPTPDRPADAPSDASRARPVRIGALAGFSTGDLGVGVGVRVGKAILSRVWLGGQLAYDFGRTTSTSARDATTRVSASSLYFGPEAGYELELTPGFLLRPYAGAGAVVVATSTTVSGAAAVGSSVTRPVAWPGMTALYDVPDTSFTVGADTRLVFLPGGPALGVFAAGEVRF